MSADSVKQIIGRAVTDTEFRGLLFSQPHKAVEGYDLTAQERTSLQGLTPQEFDSLAGTLEERISKSSPPVDIQKPGH